MSRRKDVFPRYMVELPAKVPGRHRWALTSMTDSEAAAAHEGVVSVLMGPDRMVSIGVDCCDCGQPYHVAVTQRCADAWERA